MYALPLMVSWTRRPSLNSILCSNRSQRSDWSADVTWSVDERSQTSLAAAFITHCNSVRVDAWSSARRTLQYLSRSLLDAPLHWYLEEGVEQFHNVTVVESFIIWCTSALVSWIRNRVISSCYGWLSLNRIQVSQIFHFFSFSMCSTKWQFYLRCWSETKRLETYPGKRRINMFI